MVCQYVPKKHIVLILCLLLVSLVVAGAASNPVASNATAIALKGKVASDSGTTSPPTITTVSLPAGNLGVQYMGPLSAGGGTPPYTWGVVGAGLTGHGLPSGLQLGAGGGPGTVAITGTPTVMGTYPVLVTVVDHVGNRASKPFSIVITYSPLTIATSSLPSAVVNVPYSTTLAASGGCPPYAWSRVSGSLPAGLTMNAAGVISGTPIVAGTSNFVVSVRDSQSPPATATSALSIVVSAPNDMYGGITSLPSPGGATGFFRMESAVKGNMQRNMLVSPSGHYFYMRSVLNPVPAIESGIMQSKYHGDRNLWYTHRNNQMLAWGFNALDIYDAAGGLPVGTWGGQSGSQVKLPFVMLINASADLYMNPQRIPGQVDPIKSITVGVPHSTYNGWPGRLLDTYSPQWQAGYNYEIAENNQFITGGFASVPWILGITLEDADYFWALKGIGTCTTGSPYPHPAFLIATTMFSYTAAQNNLGQPYQDAKLYSKYAWVNFLRNKYGNIAALNSAWGSHYTSFDDQGGYGVGTGLLDEDGRHSWMGHDPYNLTGITSQLKADLDAFLYQYVYQTFSTGVNSVRNSGDTNHLIIGPSALGGVGNCGMRSPVLHALKDAGVQILALNTDPRYLTTNIAITNAEHDVADLPVLIWYEVTAQADSYWHGNPTYFAAPNFPTQEIRGQQYASDQQLFYNAAGTDGVNYIMGTAWWQFTDSTAAEHTNEGLISGKDNAYDGKCAVMAPSTDPWGYPCGGETANYGDFLDAVTRSNATVMQQLISDMSGTGGAPRH